MIEKSPEIVIKINSKVLQILRVVAKSAKPLSSGDIEKRLLGVIKLRDERVPQVYSILRKVLCPQKYKYPVFLFDWNELVSSIVETWRKGETSTFDRVRRTLVNNFKSIGLKFEENSIEFTRADDNLIEIKTNDSRIITVERDQGYNDHAILKVSENGKENVKQETYLDVKTVGRKQPGSGSNLNVKKIARSGNTKVQVFYQGVKGNYFERGISYLNTSLNKRSKEASQMIRKIGRQRVIDYHQRYFTTPPDGAMVTTDQEDSVLSEIEGNRSHWEYSLNTRGLILLVLGIIKEERENRTRNIEISNILKNLSENFWQDFPYLRYYEEIKKLYDRLAKEDKGFDYFQVTLMKRIALGLQCVIDSIDTEELNYYVTKQYSQRLTAYYVSDAIALLGYPAGIPNTIRQYLLENLVYVQNYLSEELQNIEYEIGTYDVDKIIS